MGILTFKLALFKLNMNEQMRRQPDKALENIEEGIFSYIFNPKNDKEQEKFPNKAENLKNHLSQFNLDLNESKCVFASPEDQQEKILQIKIKLPKK